MAARTKTNRSVGKDDGKRLKYAFDAGFISGGHPPDSPITAGNYSGDDSEISLSSDSESCDSAGHKNRLGNLAASFRVFSESLLRMEVAELEMIKAREALRCAAEKRRVEVEAEMTQMLLQTQLQIASLFSKKTSTNRKRKRGEDTESSTREREGSLMLSLMQINLML